MGTCLSCDKDDGAKPKIPITAPHATTQPQTSSYRSSRCSEGAFFTPTGSFSDEAEIFGTVEAVSPPVRDTGWRQEMRGCWKLHTHGEDYMAWLEHRGLNWASRRIAIKLPTMKEIQFTEDFADGEIRVSGKNCWKQLLMNRTINGS